MNYQSTRGRSAGVNAKQAVLRGLAPDGGLYMQTGTLAQFPWQQVLNLDVRGMASRILQALLPDFEGMEELVRRAYDGRFDCDELTPLQTVGDCEILELFHGPTAAFKDVALSMLPQLMTAAQRQTGSRDEIVILTATSGDTGKAALEGFHDVEGVRILVFYPEDGVSEVQKAQMVTQEGKNVCVCAVRGNFDDAQTGVKHVFTACEEQKLLLGRGVQLSSANSINIGRLAPQVVYYFKAYADLMHRGRIQLGDTVDFVVPTGNFGDILAGYLAKRMGLPVGRLVCASNANNVLTEFLQTGVYDRRRPFYKTMSPSMDILVSSNLERLLYLVTDGNTEKVAAWMRELQENGVYRVDDAVLRRIQKTFSADFCDEAQTQTAIAALWQKERYLCDTHTAVAWHAAQDYRRVSGTAAPVVVLSTASPYKFPKAVLRAIGQEPAQSDFAAMRQLHALTDVPIPQGLASLQGKRARHHDCISPEQMLPYVLRKLSEKEWESE